MPFFILDLLMFILIAYYLFFSEGNYIFKIGLVITICVAIFPEFGVFIGWIFKLLWEIVLAILPEFLF